mmetsp:Transcript_45467/g.120043  ORF Transcript_45467/g.120043 Transcript_45467/m.120043 type:complete len:227 (+) Transcript_45467:1690-2370(+)
MPILIAVSTRSPVNIQTLIPAVNISLIVCPTPSCNRSSMAVPPTSSRPSSMSSAASSILAERLSRAMVAFLYCSSHSVVSCSVSFFWQITRVRRPSAANWDKALQVCFVVSAAADLGLNNACMTESAPLLYNQYWGTPSSSYRQTTELRLRLEENSMVARMRTRRLFPPLSARTIPSGLRSMNWNPKWRAPYTRAPSSGEELEYFKSAPSVSGMTSWLMAKFRKKS